MEITHDISMSKKAGKDGADGYLHKECGLCSQTDADGIVRYNQALDEQDQFQ